MAKVRRLQTHFFVCYHVTGEKLSPDRCNPLLRKFGKILKDFKIKKEDYSATISVQGDTIIQEVDSRWLKVSTHLTFEICDSSPSLEGNKWGLDHSEGAAIHNGLKELFLVDGKYSNRVDIIVKDSVQASEPPMSHENSCWPEKRW